MIPLVLDSVADELLAIRGRPIHLSLDGGPIYALLHLREDAEHSGTGVVLCPPFGVDEICAHRSLRAWAGALVHAGYPALRFDFPGTGDSGGCSLAESQRLATWTEAVDAAAALLQGQGCQRVVAIGIGIGGLVACRALARGAAIDDLALWSVPSRGSRLVREMRAFARIIEAEVIGVDRGSEAPPGLDEPAASDRGDLNVAGFVLTAEMIAELESLDLAELAVPDASRRRILLLGRDSAPPDPQIREHYERSGAAVTIADGPGYGAMMVDPQFAEIPRQVFASSIAWLADGSGARPGADVGAVRPRIPAPASDGIELTVGDALIRETPFEFEYEGVVLSGVLTEPVSNAGAHGGFCAVLLNAGAVRRIGIQRIWVEVARRWAARGVPSLRFDVVGVGDSDGEELLYRDRGAFQRSEFADQVRAAFDELERRGVADRFLVGGVCSGAYWGVHSGLVDDRVSGLLLLNLLAFFWSPELGALRDARRARALLQQREVGTVLRILATDRWRMTRMLLLKLRGGLAPGRSDESQARLRSAVVAALDQMRDRGVEVLLLLSLAEPLFDDFVADGLIDRLAEWPNLHLDQIPTNDHLFRPRWSQRYVHDALDEALARTLAKSSKRPAAD
jgi:pimeloyl-ACP methyl ester carboxylesterase